MPGVVLINPKYPHNVGAAIRACSCFGVNSLVWTGDRVNPAKYARLPREERMKGYKRVEFRNSDRPLDLFPETRIPVSVEVFDNSEPLTTFEHPENASMSSVLRTDLCRRSFAGSVIDSCTSLRIFVLT